MQMITNVFPFTNETVKAWQKYLQFPVFLCSGQNGGITIKMSLFTSSHSETSWLRHCVHETGCSWYPLSFPCRQSCGFQI